MRAAWCGTLCSLPALPTASTKCPTHLLVAGPQPVGLLLCWRLGYLARHLPAGLKLERRQLGPALPPLLGLLSAALLHCPCGARWAPFALGLAVALLLLLIRERSGTSGLPVRLAVAIIAAFSRAWLIVLHLVQHKLKVVNIAAGPACRVSSPNAAQDSTPRQWQQTAGRGWQQWQHSESLLMRNFYYRVRFTRAAKGSPIG